MPKMLLNVSTLLLFHLLYFLLNYQNILFRLCRDVNDTFSSSVLYKIQEKWAVCLSYRLKTLTNWCNKMKDEGLMNDETLSETKRLAKVVIDESVR